MQLNQLYRFGLVLILSCLSLKAVSADTALADSPIYDNKVASALLVALSVEWPTGTQAAYGDDFNSDAGYTCPGRNFDPAKDLTGDGIGMCYFTNREYLGYFDPSLCYTYTGVSGGTLYFVPVSAAAADHSCGGAAYSGNWLNWATMHALDAFRYAMTGGHRIIDQADLVVIQKTRHNGEGAYRTFPIKLVGPAFGVIPAIAPNSVSPKTWAELYVRVTLNYTAGAWPNIYPQEIANPPRPVPPPIQYDPFIGPMMEISNNPGFVNDGVSNFTEKMYVHVQVCDGVLDARDFCVPYGASLKPGGLIQEYSDRIRMGAMRYLLDPDPAESGNGAKNRNGGSLVVRIKDVGPEIIVPNGPPVDNPRKEWDPVSGVVFTNPDPWDANNSSVSKSGLINYINQFGKARGYVWWDRLAEMQREGYKYFMKKPPTAEYTAGHTAAMKDGFPVITDWFNYDGTPEDPIKHSCQNSFMLLMADTNTNCDTRLPGSTLSSGAGGFFCPGHAGALADADWPADAGASLWTNRVGGLQALDQPTGYINATIGDNPPPAFTFGGGQSWFPAGLAFYANTRDLRDDLVNNPNINPLGQTVTTFVVDVKETGAWNNRNNPPETGLETDNDPHNPDQLWLTAKFGGFDALHPGYGAGGYSYNPGTPLIRESWADALGKPLGYFVAGRPDKMVQALRDAFSTIVGRSGAAAGATLSDNAVVSSNAVYFVKYQPRGWLGDVVAHTITVNPDGTISTSVAPLWSAQAKLETLVASGGWDTARRIVTMADGVAVPFRLANLTASQQTALDLTSILGPTASSQNVLNFLRGDQSLRKRQIGGVFRDRQKVLGDIVDSEAAVVREPKAPFLDASGNAGYSAFKTAYASRTAMVYVGANDGMLHAFNGTADATGGNEVFSFVPSFLFDGPNGTPDQDGLASLTIPGYTHKYFVNASPVVQDIDFNKTDGASGAPDWRTILVGGLGKGGRGYYAIDITDPSSFTSETTISGKVLWEFTDEDMGFSYGRPLITKVRGLGGWVVVVTSGYNNIYGSVAANRGKGILYILNARTGALLRKTILADGGSESDPSGFAQITGFTQDYRDYTTEQVYGGNLFGHVWRIDVSAAVPPSPLPTQKIAELKDGGGVAQPITTAPQIEIDNDGVKRWVFIGSGRLLDSTDRTDTQEQAMYGFRDGIKSQPYGTSLPPPVAFPFTKANMLEVTDLLAGVTLSAATEVGWYVNLASLGHTAANGATERIVTHPLANEGVIAWVGNVPKVDPCDTADSYIYAVRYGTGKTELLQGPTGAEVPIPYFTSLSSLTKIQFVTIPQTGEIAIVASTTAPSIYRPDFKLRTSTGVPARLNWREILLQ